MREIGGRNDLVARVSPSVRLGRGFFSSINETVAACGFAGAGAGVEAAAAAAACAAARERAAGVSVAGIGAAAFAAPVAFVLFTPLAAGALAEAADLTAVFRAAGADFRAAVFVDVVRVGIVWKFSHGSGKPLKMRLLREGRRRGSPAPSLRQRRECPPNRTHRHPAILQGL